MRHSIFIAFIASLIIPELLANNMMDIEEINDLNVRSKQSTRLIHNSSERNPSNDSKPITKTNSLHRANNNTETYITIDTDSNTESNIQNTTQPGNDMAATSSINSTDIGINSQSNEDTSNNDTSALSSQSINSISSSQSSKCSNPSTITCSTSKTCKKYKDSDGNTFDTCDFDLNMQRNKGYCSYSACDQMRAQMLSNDDDDD